MRVEDLKDSLFSEAYERIKTKPCVIIIKTEHADGEFYSVVCPDKLRINTYVTVVIARYYCRKWGLKVVGIFEEGNWPDEWPVEDIDLAKLKLPEESSYAR